MVHNFRIRWRTICDSTGADFSDCLANRSGIRNLSGTEGLASLLGLCETNNFTDELSNKSYPSLAMEIVKRVQIPYYEEARFYPDVMKHVAATLDWPHQIYLRENLRHVVIRAKTPEEELQAERERQKAIYNDLKARGWIADPMEFLE